ncbi:LuxR C-terminal-related transcriptional regulator [Microvirga makkahensis]|uniref:HTH luxR-type domain-containing protein n=1 Tax=Microvirga makkahensis TaxID=1128670 RepID=A0A7X3MVU4_9HYPH|nr:LuxR C-terminal-related transcriptional regulator [Microvirga makkahensis]MXQ14109.1 hypothetical protein [Microvirga makkahensis]
MTARDLQRCLCQRLNSDWERHQDYRDLALSLPETEVLRRLTTGQELGDIAAQLSVSEAAVKEHIRSVFRKARARTMADQAGRLSVL